MHIPLTISLHFIILHCHVMLQQICGTQCDVSIHDQIRVINISCYLKNLLLIFIFFFFFFWPLSLCVSICTCTCRPKANVRRFPVSLQTVHWGRVEHTVRLPISHHYVRIPLGLQEATTPTRHGKQCTCQHHFFFTSLCGFPKEGVSWWQFQAGRQTGSTLRGYWNSPTGRSAQSPSFYLFLQTP